MSMQEFKSRFTALYSWVRGHLFTVILPMASVKSQGPSSELDHIFILSIHSHL